MTRWVTLVCLLIANQVIANQALAKEQQSKHCGAQGVWVEILGAGSGELNQDWAGPSYIVWIDDKARLLVDTGASSTTQFAKAGAHIEDLDAIVLSTLEPHLTTSLPAYLAGSLDSDRDRLLPSSATCTNNSISVQRSMFTRSFPASGRKLCCSGLLPP